MTTNETLGRDRRHIFENYANGVDIEAMKETFRRSAAEIEREILFVARKIAEYRFRRCADGSQFAAPPVACDTLIEIRLNRLALFDTLRKLSDRHLASPLLLPRVNIQKVDHPASLAEARYRLRA